MLAGCYIRVGKAGRTERPEDVKAGRQIGP
jgi:hypothetical protein